MRLTYDQQNNVAYLRLRAAPSEVVTLQLSEEVNIDIAPDGAVAGIEFLNANEQLRATDGGEFVIESEALGREVKVPLTAG